MVLKQYDLELDDSGRSCLAVKEDIVLDKESFVVNSPELIYKFIESTKQLSKLAEEHVYMLALNSKCKIVGVFFISKGTVNASLMSPREIFIRAFLVGAVSIVVIHNHPSGDTTPSREDDLVTARIKDAGKMLGVALIDHIIVGSGYYSYKESDKI